MIKKAYILPVMTVVMVAGIIIAWFASRLYLYSPEFAGVHTYNVLVNSAPWALLYSAGLGISLGAVAARFPGSGSGTKGGEMGRRGAGLLFEDLGMAFSLLGMAILLVTGIMMGGFITPRLLVDTAETIGFALNMHFVGIVTLLFGFGYFATRTMVSGDYSLVLSQLRGFFGSRRQSKYLPSLSWAMLAVAFAFVTLGLKGTGLLGEQILGLPREVAIVTSVSHDILALASMILGLIAVSLTISESLNKQGRAAGQPSKLKA